jgi:magnesium transporter
VKRARQDWDHATFRKSAPPPGSRPGTLAIPPGSPAPALHLFVYDVDSLEERPVTDVETLAAERDAAAQAGRKLWLDVRGLGDERVLRRIGEIFGIHPLALEDAVNVPQRAAAKAYEHHLVLIARMPRLGDGGAIDAPQVCIMIDERVVLTFQEQFFGFFEPVRGRLRAGNRPIRGNGPDYLAYALLDTLIDRYYPIAQGLSEELEELEDEVVGRPRPDVLHRVHAVRRRLVVMRRVGHPQRDAIAGLVREGTPFLSDGVRVFLRDTLDHATQITELIDASREMCVALMEIHLSNVSQRTNEVMKVLTILSSIFIPSTFLAGLYGMNFDYIPGLHQREAFALLIVGMLAIAGGMLTWFWRRGWIGRGSDDHERDR